MSEPDEQIPGGGRRITRAEYVELLTDASMREADEMEEGFAAWCELNAPQWRKAGRDEMWIRYRIESAQSTRALHDVLKKKGYSRAKRRQAVREMYERLPELYDLMIERERTEPHVSIIRGTCDDLMQRYTLRVMLYEADRANRARFCRWKGIPETEYEEDPSMAFIRDRSTVEELAYQLQNTQFLGQCFDDPAHLTTEQIMERIDEFAAAARADFIARFGYKPEDSTTPRIVVTVNGPIDPDAEFEQRSKQ